MEEEKAAAYYDELTRRGGGAARFKQGLGFSSAASTTVADDEPPARGSALPTSSFLSNFVKSSNPSEVDKQQSQLQSIQNKLQKKQSTRSIDRKPPSDDEISVRVRVSDRDRGKEDERRRERDTRRQRSRSRSRSRRRSRSRSRSRERGSGSRRRYHRSSSRERRRRRSLSPRERNSERGRDRRGRSRSLSPRERNSERGRDRRRRSRSRSRSLSPRRRNSERERSGDDGGGGRKRGVVVKKERSGAVDYARLIHGYDKMTPAERVKAKMKLQLSQTAEKDEKMGAGSQWERFDFDKDAPIEDEILEAADDDAAVSKRIGQSFRFASLEGKREDDIKNAHDEAMFGVPATQPPQTSESENESENEEKPTNDTDMHPVSSLLNEKVLSKQQGSWRDRARRNVG